MQIKKCVVQKEEDGQKCAQEMLADDSVKFVLTGTLVLGNQPLFDTLAGQKPVFIGNPVTTPDFLAKDAYAFTPGSPGVIQGMAIFAANRFPGGQSQPRWPSSTRQPGCSGGLQPPDQAHPGEVRHPVDGRTRPGTAGPQESASAIQAAGARMPMWSSR